jgi:hypothetical protein
MPKNLCVSYPASRLVLTTGSSLTDEASAHYVCSSSRRFPSSNRISAATTTTTNAPSAYLSTAGSVGLHDASRASARHSPVDARVPSIVADYGLLQGVDTATLQTGTLSILPWARALSTTYPTKRPLCSPDSLFESAGI